MAPLTHGPVDLFERIDMAKLYPPFRDKLVEVILRCRLNRGADYWATRGFATYQEQTQLWLQGRSTARPGKVVTDAMGGQSAHNFGLAVDFAFDTLPNVPKLQPGYDPKEYVILGEEAMRAGLAWGGSWVKRDCPHVQWPGFVSVGQLRSVKKAFDGGGLQAAWDCVACLDGARGP